VALPLRTPRATTALPQSHTVSVLRWQHWLRSGAQQWLRASCQAAAAAAVSRGHSQPAPLHTRGAQPAPASPLQQSPHPTRGAAAHLCLPSALPGGPSNDLLSSTLGKASRTHVLAGINPTSHSSAPYSPAVTVITWFTYLWEVGIFLSLHS